jgi:hypothetical protein
MVATAWVLSVAVVLGAAVSSDDPSHASANPSIRTAGVADAGAAWMLEGDMRMLERMRTAVSQSMDAMIAVDPMWVNPEMIQAQEGYQAQIDRMLARR